MAALDKVIEALKEDAMAEARTELEAEREEMTQRIEQARTEAKQAQRQAAEQTKRAEAMRATLLEVMAELDHMNARLGQTIQ